MLDISWRRVGTIAVCTCGCVSSHTVLIHSLFFLGEKKSDAHIEVASAVTQVVVGRKFSFVGATGILSFRLQYGLSTPGINI